MAAMTFAAKLSAGQPLQVFGDGRQRRAFTYIDDAVRGTLAILQAGPPSGEPPAALCNLGSEEDVELLDFIRILGREMGVEVEIKFAPEPPGEMRATLPDMSAMRRDFGFEPRVSLEEGLTEFVRWFREYSGRALRFGPLGT
jgi:UDP-glucuronate 4-epimerase